MKSHNYLDVGDVGILHAKEILNYENELCIFATKALDNLVSPEVFTFLPVGSENTSIELGRGGLSSNMFSPLSEYLYQKNKQYSLVFDDVMASPNDSYFEEKFTRRTSIENDVFHIASVNELKSIRDITALIGQVSVAWHFLCVLLKTPQIMPAQLSFLDLRFENISEIIVGAFDGEGFLVIREKQK